MCCIIDVFNSYVYFQIKDVFGFGSGNSYRTNATCNDTSPLQNQEMLDQLIRSLLEFQSQQTPDSQQTTINRFHQLSQSLRQSSRRSNTRQQSTRTSLLRKAHSARGKHEHHGE